MNAVIRQLRVATVAGPVVSIAAALLLTTTGLWPEVDPGAYGPTDNEQRVAVARCMALAGHPLPAGYDPLATTQQAFTFNGVILDRLPAEEQERFLDALLGDRLGDGGCYRRAAEELDDDGAAARAARWRDTRPNG